MSGGGGGTSFCFIRLAWLSTFCSDAVMPCSDVSCLGVAISAEKMQLGTTTVAGKAGRGAPPPALSSDWLSRLMLRLWLEAVGLPPPPDPSSITLGPAVAGDGGSGSIMCSCATAGGSGMGPGATDGGSSTSTGSDISSDASAWGPI